MFLGTHTPRSGFAAASRWWSRRPGLALAAALALLPSCSSSPVRPPDLAGPLDRAGADRTATERNAPDLLGPDAAECPVSPSTEPDVVATSRGLVRGKAAGSSVAFLGIPYADPPIGLRRFAPPAPRACWAGVREATAYGPRCAQKTTLGVLAGEEDCLSLNVWTPALPSGKEPPAPVLFFIHGGANLTGGSNEGAVAVLGNLTPGAAGNLYDGEKLASKQKVVVVTVNYRLGALGFLAHPELSRQSPTRTSGNWAILDLIAALEWTRRNIAAFGGDPDRVMVFGESAGALNTCMLLASPRAKGLFQAALMESGGCHASPLATREAAGQTLASKVGCAGTADAVACLRAAKLADLVEATGAFLDLASADVLHMWDLLEGAAVDGQIIPDSPIKLLAEGKHNQVPFAIGTNAEEAALFVPLLVTCSAYENEVKKRFGALADQVLVHYPCADYSGPRWAGVAVISDAVFTCEARRVARALAKSQSKPVFRYHFRHVYKSSLVLPALRAFHGAELPFVFQSFGAAAYLPTSGEVALSDAMQGYWARLAAKGDPSGGSAPAWPAHLAAEDNLLVLDEPISTDAALRAKQCDFWDGLSK